MFERTLLPDGTICFSAAPGRLSILRPCSGVVVLIIEGHDVGLFGDAPLEELRADVRAGPVRLFVDARATRGATMDVSETWAAWLQRHQAQLAAMHMLVRSPIIRITAEFVRRFIQLGDRMQIHDAPAPFEQALGAALLRRPPPPAVGSRGMD